MSEITPNKQKIETTIVRSPSGKEYELHYVEFLDLRCQIADKEETGWVAIHKGEEIPISECGSCSSYPIGFFDAIESQLFTLLQIKSDRSDTAVDKADGIGKEKFEDYFYKNQLTDKLGKVKLIKSMTGMSLMQSKKWYEKHWQ
jgi:hypothetical protein